MKSAQKIVDEMYSGNTECIISNIFSSNPYLVINAIICGVRYRLNSPDFIYGIRVATSNTQRVLGYAISSVANAAMCILNDMPYRGDDRVTIELIKSNFEI